MKKGNFVTCLLQSDFIIKESNISSDINLLPPCSHSELGWRNRSHISEVGKKSIIQFLIIGSQCNRKLVLNLKFFFLYLPLVIFGSFPLCATNLISVPRSRQLCMFPRLPPTAEKLKSSECKQNVNSTFLCLKSVIRLMRVFQKRNSSLI